MREVHQGQFYRHFKNRLYQVVAVAEHSETGERMVVYQALYGEYRVYARPYEMFVSEVDHEKYPQADQKYRFELVKPADGQKESQNPEIPKSGYEQTDVQEPAAERAEERIDVQEQAAERAEEQTDVQESVIQRAEEQTDVQESVTQRAEEQTDTQVSACEKTDEGVVNPLLLEFLDADTLEDKMHIMIFGRNQMDDNLLNSIAISLDLVVEEKSTEEKYDEILNCLSMMERFECNRLR
ncbi:MAG: DUF1653 domain-containing protein [Lachnospiraceae bacterium]|nr:DUF1653 domain-containing protein [Lachnospiraceae bacterium]